VGINEAGSGAIRAENRPKPSTQHGAEKGGVYWSAVVPTGLRAGNVRGVWLDEGWPKT